MSADTRRYVQMIKEESLLIDTTGQKVGELNGLTVMSIGDYTFGKPAKITVNTYTGKDGIINPNFSKEIWIGNYCITINIH